MVEVRDHNSGAILFKSTSRERKVEDLEKRVEELTKKLETLTEMNMIKDKDINTK